MTSLELIVVILLTLILCVTFIIIGFMWARDLYKINIDELKDYKYLYAQEREKVKRYEAQLQTIAVNYTKLLEELKKYLGGR